MACFRASLIPRVFLCAPVTARRLSPACPDPSHPTAADAVRPQPTAMHASAGLLSFFCASLISRVCFAYSVVRKLFESAWIGSQAFNEAKAFNANIGAWNTARIANMASVCSHCHRLHGWRTGRCLDVCVPRCCLWHSLLFRALRWALRAPCAELTVGARAARAL